MRILHRTALRRPPEQSIVLVDWSVRESHHALDYLAAQNVPRDRYEILWIEYYASEAAGIRDRLARAAERNLPAPVDQWIVLEMPPAAYYHKHLLYDVGLVASRGRIVTFCDSDAIFGPGFVRAHVEAFGAEPAQVLHLDEIRSRSRAFYPFSHPTVDEVLASDCINLVDGRPAGIPGPGGEPLRDALHVANYGACMSARREDLIAIGGADEHLDHLGHVCGPYEMTFRLVNAGLAERWHEREWIFHTWHPGASGEQNFVGPHDGRHVSSSALRARETGRVLPRVENPAVRALREAALRPSLPGADDLLVLATAPEMATAWSAERLSIYSSEGRTLAASMRAYPALVLRAGLRVAQATTAYAALVARTSGLLQTPGLGEDRGSALAARVRSLSGKARKMVTRARLPLDLARDVAAAVREPLARARQRLEGLASEGLREIQLLGTADLVDAIRAFAPAHGIRIARTIDLRDGEAATLRLDREGPPVLLGLRFGLARVREMLIEQGFDRDRVLVLDPEWSREERLPRATQEVTGGAGQEIAISIVMPTRGRPSLARATLEALAKTAGDPRAIEVVLYVDEDDEPSHAIGCDALRIVRLVGERAPMGAITERCVASSSGRIVLLLNDDVHVARSGWDARIVEAFARFDDGIALVWGDDLHQRDANPTFPALSRAAVDVLGCVTAPQYVHFHIESHLYDVFARLARAGHERRVFLPDVVFEHHFAAGGAGAAGTGRKRHAQRDRVTYGLLAGERARAAERLQRTIERGHEDGGGTGAVPVDVARRSGGVDASHGSAAPFELEPIGTPQPAPRLTVLLLADERARAPFGAGAKIPAPRDLAEAGLAPGTPTEVCLVRWYSGSPGVALQSAAGRARGDILLCLPLGAGTAPGFAAKIANAFAADPRRAAVSGLVVEQRCGRLRRASACLARESGRSVIHESGRGIDPARFVPPSEGATTNAGSGIFGLAVRRSAFDSVGGLAQDLSSELLLGLDLCRRLSAAGHEFALEPDLRWRLPPDSTPLETSEIDRLARAWDGLA